MKCYIYIIENSVNGKKYVGQTTNFSRRISDHFQKLRTGKHVNPKLQAAFDKYGEDAFKVTKIKYDDLTKEELDQKEIEAIVENDAFPNGYNLTIGGTGGNIRGKLSFEQYCFAYFGNKKYEGLLNRTAKVLNCDGSTVSALVRDKSYDAFREKALKLSQKEKDKYLKDFEEKLNLKEEPPKPQKKKMSDEDIINFLCVTSTYGRGAEAAYIREKDISKGLGHHIRKGEYINAQKKFLQMTDEEIEDRAVRYFTEHKLQQFCVQHINKNTSIKKELVVGCAL